MEHHFWGTQCQDYQIPNERDFQPAPTDVDASALAPRGDRQAINRMRWRRVFIKNEFAWKMVSSRSLFFQTQSARLSSGMRLFWIFLINEPHPLVNRRTPTARALFINADCVTRECKYYKWCTASNATGRTCRSRGLPATEKNQRRCDFEVSLSSLHLSRRHPP